MKLETLGKTTWDKIKIGEVFAYEGCWTVAVKTAENKAMVLDCDKRSSFLRMLYDAPGLSAGKEYTRKKYRGFENVFVRDGYISYALTTHPFTDREKGFHKLPVAVQRLWRCDK